MKKYVETYNAQVGFHKYPNAPEFCHYLSHTHRHVFTIRCSFEVSDNDREVEINQRQLEIEQFLQKKFGNPCQFGGMSCEDIAELVIGEFHAHKVTVKEDDYGGATFTE